MMQNRQFTYAAYSLFLVAFAVCTAQEPPVQPTITNGDFETDEPGAATIGKLPAGWAKHYGHRVLSVVSEARPGREERSA